MTKIEKSIAKKNKILQGLKLVHLKLIEFKKQKNSPLVVMKDNRIVWIKPN